MGTDTEVDNCCGTFDHILINYTIHEEITIYVPEFNSYNKCCKSIVEQ
jgi:hypothetical protein